MNLIGIVSLKIPNIAEKEVGMARILKLIILKVINFQSQSCPGDRMSSPTLSPTLDVEMTNTSSASSSATRRSTRVANSDAIEETEIDNSAGQSFSN